jgi:hypothetical protein
MTLNLRALLLLASVVMIVLKLAGVLAWPWLAILIPLLFWAIPFIISVVCVGVMAAGAFLLFLIGCVVFAVAFVVDWVKSLLPRKRKLQGAR